MITPRFNICSTVHTLKNYFRSVAFIGALAASTAPNLFAAVKAPLADAVEKRDLATARALIGDTDVNAAQPDGMTALHWAAQHDDVEMVKALLAAQANAKAENRYGVTPLGLACTNGNAAIVGLLLDAGANPNAV